jgi:hypothetical protein
VAALARWLSLERLALNNDWRTSIGSDDRSIDRLLSPHAEWLAHHSGAGVTTIGLVVPASTGSDVADDFNRSARLPGGTRLNYPRHPALTILEPNADAALALLLLSDGNTPAEILKLAAATEIAGAALTLRDAIDPRAHELVRIFARIFSPQELSARDQGFLFYRRMVLAAKDAAGNCSAREKVLLKALYDRQRAAADFFTVEELNGGMLDDFEILRESNAVFDRLEQTFAGMQQ